MMLLLRALLLILYLALPRTVLAQSSPLEVPSALDRALNQLRNGHYQQALQTAAAADDGAPVYPLSPLIIAEAYWGMIFCQTGHITEREIWNTADADTSPQDELFFNAVEETLAASEALGEREPSAAAVAHFYDGMAHAVRAQVYTLRGKVLQSGREGKQMRASLLQAISKEPILQPDAAAGLGVYNYYADVLSPLLKLFRMLLLIPGGDRERGLEQLQTASQHAALLAPEARWELARILGIREGRHREALALLQELAAQYPGNALYILAAAYEAEHLGEKEAAAQLAAQAAVSALEMDPACHQRVAAAASRAVVRLRPAQ
jgi:hypothetical protein